MQDGQVHSGGLFDRHGETKAGHTKLCTGLQGFTCFSKMGRVMGHGWGKKLAQNNSKPRKVVVSLALTLCFATAFCSLRRTIN